MKNILVIISLSFFLLQCNKKNITISTTIDQKEGKKVDTSRIVNDTNYQSDKSIIKNPEPVNLYIHYEEAYRDICGMLLNPKSPDFKKAVFVTENAWFDNRLNYSKFDNFIKQEVDICKLLLNSNKQFNYDYPDKEKVIKNWAIFEVMTDTIELVKGLPLHFPFYYDFEDYLGKKDWSRMFVTNLLSTHKGNCHSLPFLYKILAIELDTEAWLAFAPNHIYIKHRSKKTGMYNTELTSAEFPLDAWVACSGYISTEAMINGIYMDTLSLKQSIVYCLVDLAKGSERKFGIGDGRFIIQCLDKCLEHYPNCINALLMKAETKKALFEKIMKANNAQYPSEVMNNEEARVLFKQMQQLYKQINDLGYNEMPEQNYKEWLKSLQTVKFQNQAANTVFKSNSK